MQRSVAESPQCCVGVRLPVYVLRQGFYLCLCCQNINFMCMQVLLLCCISVVCSINNKIASVLSIYLFFVLRQCYSSVDSCCSVAGIRVFSILPVLCVYTCVTKPGVNIAS